MSSPDLLRRILDAWFDLDQADPPERGAAAARRDAAIAAALQGSNIASDRFLRALHHRYRIYRADRLAAARRTGRAP